MGRDTAAPDHSRHRTVDVVDAGVGLRRGRACRGAAEIRAPRLGLQNAGRRNRALLRRRPIHGCGDIAAAMGLQRARQRGGGGLGQSRRSSGPTALHGAPGNTDQLLRRDPVLGGSRDRDGQCARHSGHPRTGAGRPRSTGSHRGTRGRGTWHARTCGIGCDAAATRPSTAFNLALAPSTSRQRLQPRPRKIAGVRSPLARQCSPRFAGRANPLRRSPRARYRSPRSRERRRSHP
jgi:hypothetical protein